MPTEPCPRCPPFVVRCGHLGERALSVWRGDNATPGGATIFVVVNNFDDSSRLFFTRAEADEEFERREEALLA